MRFAHSRYLMSIHISLSTWIALLLVCATCSAASLCCLRLVFAPAICSGLALFGIIVLAGRGGLILSYMTSSLARSFPLRDPLLAEIDLTLGFEWTTMMAWFDHYPTFTEIGRYAYDSLIYQQVIVPFVLILFRQYRMAQLTVLILITSLILTHLIALFIPAVSSYPFYEIDPSQHPHIRLSQENVFVPHVEALRSGATAISICRPGLPSRHFQACIRRWPSLLLGHCARLPMSGGQVSSPTP